MGPDQTTSLPATHATPAGGSRRPIGFRALVDVAATLLIAVILFRGFAVEGYIISTGSMAPSLLGFHKRVLCPACGYRFAYGISAGAGGMAAESANRNSHGREETLAHALLHGPARCPNCGDEAIDLNACPPNHGDQLLVLKNAFEFRRARRWEVVVLKSPSRPTPPFVKRVVGLPGESVQVVDGDIEANGAICRKDLTQQIALRILVNDHDHVPNDPPDGRPCWTADPADKASGASWQAAERGFQLRPATPASGLESAEGKQSGQDSIAWLTFRRWIRQGGSHQSEVELKANRRQVHLPGPPFEQVQFDAEAQLVCTGALSSLQRDRLLALNPHEEVQRAVVQLAELSHQPPVTDVYGYNPADSGPASAEVRDVMLECTARLSSPTGELICELRDGGQSYQLTIDGTKNESRLSSGKSAEPLRTTPLPAEVRTRPFQIILSLFDRQIVAAIDGAILFPPLDLAEDEGSPPRAPIRIGGRGVSAQVSALKVYRDIYYTRGRARHGVTEPVVLGNDEYFVLGDNSPISNDGRNWVHGGIRESALLGKPLVVHLPSRPGEFTIGGRKRYIRIPDLARIRYIR